MHSFCVCNQSLTTASKSRLFLAQWLEHWTFNEEVLGSNPVGVESFSAIPYFSSLRLSYRKIWHRVHLFIKYSNPTVVYCKVCPKSDVI